MAELGEGPAPPPKEGGGGGEEREHPRRMGFFNANVRFLLGTTALHGFPILGSYKAIVLAETIISSETKHCAF